MTIDIQTISSLIIMTATVMSALAVIIQYSKLTTKKPIDAIRRWLNKPIEEKLNELKDDNAKCHSDIKLELTEHSVKLYELSVAKMRSDLFDDKIPLAERVNVANKYEATGENGEAKVMIKILKEQLEKEMRC